MKNIGILGSTGSIGTQTLDVIDAIHGKFNIKYLTANQNVKKLAEQVKLYKPEIVCIVDENKLPELKNLLQKSNSKIVSGRQALLDLSLIHI